MPGADPGLVTAAQDPSPQEPGNEKGWPGPWLRETALSWPPQWHRGCLVGKAAWPWRGPPLLQADLLFPHIDFQLTSAFHFTLHCLCSSKLPELAFCPWENQLDSQAGWSRAQPLPSLPRDPQAFSHQHLLRTSVLPFIGNYPNSIVTAMTGTLLF